MKHPPLTHEQFLATIDQDRFPEAICTIWGELDYVLRWTDTEDRLAITEHHPEGITSSQIWFVVQ